MRSEQINEVVQALSKAQAEFRRVVWDKSNPHFKSRYASLEAIIDAIREPLAKNNLALSHIPVYEDNKLFVEVCLFHASGQFLGCKIPVNVDKPGNQALGSALTYVRRYGICCLLNVNAGEDDDGNDAEPVKPEPKPEAKPEVRTNAEGEKLATEKQIEAIKKLRDANPKNRDKINDLIRSYLDKGKAENVPQLPYAAAYSLIQKIIDMVKDESQDSQ